MFAPESIEELRDWLVQCHAQSLPVRWCSSPWSTGTQEKTLQLNKLNNVIDHAYRDMTITIECGITISQLQSTLLQQGQYLPLEVPAPDLTTLAEVIGKNWFGSLSAGYGRINDYLLGISALDGQGRIFHSGGRVVKNVAGYDLHRMLIGTSGQLAIPLTASLKVNPFPAQMIARCYQLSSEISKDELWRKIRALPFDPDRFEFTSRGTLILGRIGTETLVSSALNAFDEVVGETASDQWDQEWDPIQKPAPWNEIEPALLEVSEDNRVLLRIGVCPDETVSMVNSVAASGLHACGLASIGVVIAWGDAARCRERLPQLIQDAPLHSRTTLCDLAPEELQSLLQQTDPSDGNSQLREKTRKLFDPAGIFSIPLAETT